MEQQEKLRAIVIKVRVQSFHKINFYLQYIDSIEGGKPINPRNLNNDHLYFRQTGAVREITLVRDMLNMTDSDGIFGL